MTHWAKQLREHGMPFEISLIYGLPHQTLDSFRASIAFAQVQQVGDRSRVLNAWMDKLWTGGQLPRLSYLCDVSRT